MEVIIFLGILVLICFLAYLLGLRDEKNFEKKLLAKLKRDYGKAPGRKYKEDDLDHLNGYFLKHPNEFQIDDTTWNDLNMDGVFARLNYCLSATGEEYLYHMLRTPSQSGDMEDLERHIEFFRNNDDARYSFQLIFAKIGRKIRYSIYDYIAYLDDMPDLSNRKHFMMLGLMAIAVATCFINFTTGFTALVILMVANIIMYFAKKGEIEPYLATYGYIMKVVKSVELFEKIKYPEVEKDIENLVDAAKAFKSFERGSYILMSPSRMNSGGNPIEILLDYIRMSTHIDIIKFNQMYKEIIAHKDELDRILTITGKLEAQISIACYRESVKEQFTRPVFVKNGAYSAQDLIHPLIEKCVANSVNTQNGMLITGSNASGKSTFLNKISPELSLATREISRKLGRGKHTTRSVDLYPFMGGYLADTPGFSALDFERDEKISKDILADYFPDIAKHTDGCFFTGCSHTVEKGCMVLEALQNGEIDPSRHENYRYLYEEAARIEKNKYN